MALGDMGWGGYGGAGLMVGQKILKVDSKKAYF